MIRKTLTALLLSVLQAYSAATFATSNPASTDDIAQLLMMLSGNFDNYREMQFKAHGEQAAPSKTNHYERMSINRQTVTSEKLPGHWLYAQTNKTDAKNMVYRQRLLEFFVTDAGVINSRIWQITDPAVKKTNSPTAAYLSQLSKENLAQVLPDSCLIQWLKQGDHFVGVIDVESCVIQSKYKNEKRKLFSEEIVFSAGNWFREGAYGTDGKLIFGLDNNHYYRFQKNSMSKK